MASYGFVYVLRNDGMPDLYKIGCTERSPHARAEELSSASGVPHAFEVVCFVEVRDCFGFEKTVHGWLNGSRVNPSREFFDAQLGWIIALLKFYPHRLSFTLAVSAFDLQVVHDVNVSELRDPFAQKEDGDESAKDIADEAISAAKVGVGLRAE
jgi:hypothetical protein